MSAFCYFRAIVIATRAAGATGTAGTAGGPWIYRTLHQNEHVFTPSLALGSASPGTAVFCYFCAVAIVARAAGTAGTAASTSGISGPGDDDNAAEAAASSRPWTGGI